VASDSETQATGNGFMKGIVGERLEDARSMLHDELVVY
jgi:hypothetical protein